MKKMKVSKKYKAAKGAMFDDSTARIYGRHLDKLADRFGTVTTDIILEDARKKSSPIHDYFEWDDTAAAEKYRRDQARNLIQSVKVIVTYEDGEEKEKRHSVSVRVTTEDNNEPQAYVALKRVADDEALMGQLRDEAVKELRRIRDKFDMFEDEPGFHQVYEAIDQFALNRSLPNTG